MFMKQILKKTLILVLISMPIFLVAQDKKWTENVKFGINGGGYFGQVYSFINLSPTVAYIFSDHFVAGINLPLFYISDGRFTKKLNSFNYGVSPFARYFVTDNLYLHGEIENMNVQRFDAFTLEKAGRTIYNTPMVGAGYFQRSASGGGVYIQALYILNYSTTNSYYNSPILLRVGVML